MNNQSFYPGRMNAYPDTFVEAAEVPAAEPVIPLPNPGEGGPVDSGNGNSSGNGSGNDAGATPVIPLPNPGEGGPVANPENNNHNHGMPPIFRPVFPGSGNQSSVTVIPGITFPCFNCTASSFGRVRILNASTGYQPFYVYIGNWLVASQLANGDITSYVQAASGSQTITVSGANGYIYIQKPIQVRSSASVTVAIINTASGLDIMEISDISCSAPSGSSCLRTCNLSMNLGPFDVSLVNQSGTYNAFTNVRYREVTPYSSFYPNWYQIYIARTGSFPQNAIGTTSATLNANTSYTLYIFNAPTAAEGLRTMIVTN